MFKILIGVVVVTIAVIGGFLLLDPNSPVRNNSSSGTSTVNEVEESNQITITVEGEVYKPGTYTLAEGATMNDLLTAASGVTNNADARAYYETATLSSGITYYIASTYDANDVCGSTQISKVNINQDDSKTLSGINGISSTVADAIVTYRTSKGAFSTIEQLQEVYGIGSATYKKIRNYVILHE